MAEEKLANIRTVRVLAREQQETDNYTNSTLHVLELARREALARAGFFGMVRYGGDLAGGSTAVSEQRMTCHEYLLLLVYYMLSNVVFNN